MALPRIYVSQASLGSIVRLECGCTAEVTGQSDRSLKEAPESKKEKCKAHSNVGLYSWSELANEKKYPCILLSGEIERPPPQPTGPGHGSITKTAETGSQMLLSEAAKDDVIALKCGCAHVVRGEESKAYGKQRKSIGYPLVPCKDHPTQQSWDSTFNYGASLGPSVVVTIVGKIRRKSA